MTSERQVAIEEQAILHALGMLSQAEAQAFERALAEGEESSREQKAVFDQVVAGLGYQAPEASPSPVLRERLLARVSALSQEPAPSTALPRAPEANPFLHVRAEEGVWTPVGEGALVKVLFFDTAHDTVTTLVRLAPGGRLPRHRHDGVEQSIILEGDCRVNGEIFGPGDYRCALSGSTDTEVTTEHGTLFMMISPRHVEVLP